MKANGARRVLAGLAGSLAIATGGAAEPALTVGEPVTGPFRAASKAVDPLTDLPGNIRQISSFGERAVFSPDGTKIAFVERSYGDVFEYEIATGRIRNLTAHVPNVGFLRVHYLKDGSYLLLAPRRMAATPEETRFSNIELWWMDAKAEGQIIPLNQKVYEGIAVSPTSNQIVWSNITPNLGRRPYGIGAKSSLTVGEVRVTNGRPSLVNARPLVSRNWDDCQIEAQDFFDGDRQITASCYVFNKSRAPGAKLVSESQVYTVRLADGSMTRIPTPLELYAEVEGVFPSGRHTTVECGNDNYQGLDICVLELKPDHPHYTRLTFVQDYGAYRFSNPTIRRDGRLMAFQVGLAAEEAGAGRGILLMDLPPGF